jgi:hypothetical protein
MPAWISQSAQRLSGRSGFDSRQVQEIFRQFHSVQTGSAAFADSYPMSTGNSLRPGSETYHLHPASAEVKNGGALLLFTPRVVLN